MEDRVQVKYLKPSKEHNFPVLYFAVFDGHGGADAADFAKSNLFNEITHQKSFWSEDINEVVASVKTGFISTHNKMLEVVGKLKVNKL